MRGPPFAPTDLHSRTRSWVVYPLLGVYALCAFGGGYQTIRESIDRRMHVVPGQLIDVGGHRLHLNCIGSGTPAVILESGLGETAAYWAGISTAIARDTKVCGYDRAGRGWSDPVSAAQHGLAGQETSTSCSIAGAFWFLWCWSVIRPARKYVRIFAGRYPEQVAGMVLLDGQPAEAFERLPTLPGLLRWLPPRLCAAPVGCSARSRAAGLSLACRATLATCSV